MKLLNIKINGPKILKTKIFFDDRGFFKEVYKKYSNHDFEEILYTNSYINNISRSIYI